MSEETDVSPESPLQTEADADPAPLTIYDLLDEISNENETDILKLVYEYQVEEKLPCQCRECLLDITAVALNYLPPQYSVSIHRDLYITPEAKAARRVEVEAAVLHACEKVKIRPHH
ncbi:MAG: late competence development ComFB family protein [Candidatus Sericytochromatia bacterium]|nr:late competence development ComFB family protein [Candidatus Sericytochromatia bacterium]